AFVEQVPSLVLQVAAKHGPGAVQTTAPAGVQTAALHDSPSVHAFPSSQALPSGSAVQVAEQQSPSAVLPSSQDSCGSLMPSPQISAVQSARQPSPGVMLPSSHPSPGSWVPFAHGKSAPLAPVSLTIV